jgi:hypothetical protein
VCLPNSQVKPIGFADFITPEGLIRILGLPLNHPDRIRAREWYGAAFYPVFDSQSESGLVIAASGVMGRVFVEGPRAGVAGVQYNANMFGD